MMPLGLASVTFRSLDFREVIALTMRAGLDGIEWGGDIHAPSGDTALARKVGAWTRLCNLQVLSYGSYFRAGEGEDFAPVLASAEALGAPQIRIWAGQKSRNDSFDAVVKNIRAACDSAAKRKIRIVSEFHGGTFADRADAVLKLIENVDRDNFQTSWQQHIDAPDEFSLEELDKLFGRIGGCHVFYWRNLERMTLGEGKSFWQAVASRVPCEVPMFMEFVRDDDAQQFFSDAAVLKEVRA